MKRLIAILLVLAMLPLPVVFSADSSLQPESTQIPDEAYDAVGEDVWDDIYALEQSEIIATRGTSATAQDYAALTDEIVDIVIDSETYEEDTLVVNGSVVFWQTTSGITCGYSPELREKSNKQTMTEPIELSIEEDDVVSLASKNSPSRRDVTLVQPYWQVDLNFTAQYYNEAKSLAKTTGGSLHHLYRDYATIDAIADALETSAVVIFDSHGTTDYYNPYNTDDCVSRANTSYLCLQSKTGITSADMEYVTGTYGSYPHAFCSGKSTNSDGNTMYSHCIDGTAIANHMDKQAPNNMLWMAICLGMATDGICAPLRSKGVGVVYGYSQSVTFFGDYTFESVFWQSMKDGHSVATAAKTMKQKCGNWDCSKELFDYNGYSYADWTCYTISQARSNYAAFPIIASAQDAYPGKGNVDNLQTVKSTWYLISEGCAHTNTVSTHKDPTCVEAGYDRIACSDCGATISETSIPALGHDYRKTIITPAVGDEDGLASYTCTRCGHYYTAAICPCNDFTDLDRNQWYHEGIDFVLNHSLMNGVGKNKFEPYEPMSRAMLVTVLWRLAGQPKPSGSNPFSDVKNSQWFTDAIVWASENSIVNGVGKGKFEPDENVTRQQMAAIFYRYANYVGMDTSDREDLSSFPDASKVDSWATEALQWAVASSLITGSKEGGKVYLLPNGNAERAQAATILMRFSRMNQATNIRFSDGSYLVGRDIPAGSYYAAYVEGSPNPYVDIIVSETYEGLTDYNDYGRLWGEDNPAFIFFTVKEGQWLKVLNGDVVSLDLAPAVFGSPVNGVWGSGVYRVGKDIPYGTYTFEIADGNDDAFYVGVYKDYEREHWVAGGIFFPNQSMTITLDSDTKLVCMGYGKFYKLD